jgi:hypothetical protein
METIDYSKTMRQLYTATAKIQQIEAETATFLAVDGQGEPGGEVFQSGIQALYAVAYTLKFMLKQEKVVDFKVGKLECLHLSDPHTVPKEEWQWRLLLRVPETLASQHLAQAKRLLKERKGPDVARVKRIRWKEGLALQTLHVGPFDQVGATYARLVAYASEHGVRIQCIGHEIYLNDPRRVAAARLKTIVRVPVMKR